MVKGTWVSIAYSPASLCYPLVITPDQCAEFVNEESEDLTDL
nr:MAG TPA: hypothetical protein [Bacteriophage sp.]